MSRPMIYDLSLSACLVIISLYCVGVFTVKHAEHAWSFLSFPYRVRSTQYIHGYYLLVRCSPAISYPCRWSRYPSEPHQKWERAHILNFNSIGFMTGVNDGCRFLPAIILHTSMYLPCLLCLSCLPYLPWLHGSMAAMADTYIVVVRTCG
ncbi:hypothetical protein F5B19DRAFT_435082 [Rostrohypoxylon terebratum]|nr:hypothetical protein F5B19DRAFT_435082 [Rostrohypoxylon terebratum]